MGKRIGFRQDDRANWRLHMSNDWDEMIMSYEIEAEPVVLGPGETLALEGAACGAMHVVSGTIWVTDGEGRDLIVAAGEDAVFSGRGRIVVSALKGTAAFEHFVLEPQILAA